MKATHACYLSVLALGSFIASCKKDDQTKGLVGTWHLATANDQAYRSGVPGDAHSYPYNDGVLTLEFKKDHTMQIGMGGAFIPGTYRVAGDMLFTDPQVIIGITLDSTIYSISAASELKLSRRQQRSATEYADTWFIFKQ